MPARNGKIARLPAEIREELNQRLADGELACNLVDWLNELAPVQAILIAHFGGHPISDQNLSEWRQGGYAEWHFVQKTLSDAAITRSNVSEFASVGITSGDLLAILTTKFAAALHEYNILSRFSQDRLTNVTVLIDAVLRLRGSEMKEARLELDRTRAELAREKHHAKHPVPQAPSQDRPAAPSSDSTPAAVTPTASPETHTAIPPANLPGSAKRTHQSFPIPESTPVPAETCSQAPAPEVRPSCSLVPIPTACAGS